GLAAGFGVALALVGCGIGCDGERAKSSATPRPPDPSAMIEDTDPAALVSEPDPIVLGATGFLDAPAGTLDGLFAGLASAERADASGRVLVLFFGDSHTAGDSMTSRLRTTWQSRFGDAGRGLVAAGKPPTRHYYQRDVRYGRAGDWKASVG